MKGRNAIKLNQWLAIVLSSTFVGLILSVYDHYFLQTPVVLQIEQHYSFATALYFNLLGSFVGGVVGGAIMVYYIQERFSDKPYGFTIIALLVIFISLVLVTSFIFLIFYAQQLTGKPFSDPETRKLFKELMFHKINPVFFIYVPVIILQQLMLQVSNKFGPGVFWKMIRGTYHTSKNENRIFMFVDLNDSTTLAENLSDERYHEFLKYFFADLTRPILDHAGEIYQYLGDGMILAWQYYGDERDLRAVHCFFDMKKSIEMKKEKYQQKFGLVPAFKAGIHCGKVVVGEIGIIKRDISYSGDVVNTTSRIQGMCKELNSELLVSNELLRSFPPASGYDTVSVGSFHLKGKAKDVELASVRVK